MKRRVWIAGLSFLASACSLVESFDGYSDDWGDTDASAGGAGAGGFGASGGWPIVDSGEGGPVCPDNLQVCAESCVDVGTDGNHCGSCGVAVDPGEYCVNGTPACRPGTSVCDKYEVYDSSLDQWFWVYCDFACVDLAWDSSFCLNKSTGKKSRCIGSSKCIDGSCVAAACPAGRTACPAQYNSSCFELMRDPLHCGTCSNHCLGNEVCVLGKCVEYTVGSTEKECTDAGMTPCANVDGWAHPLLCVAGTTCPS